MDPIPRLQRGPSLVGVALLVLTLAACGSNGPPAEAGSSTTGSSPPETTVIPTDAEHQVLAAYQEFWQVWLRANNPPNPDYPELANVATGAELATVKAAIAKKVADGTFTVLPPGSRYRHSPQFKGLSSAGDATVTDCAFDDAQLIRASTGEVVNGDIATQLIVGHLRNVESRWRVLDIDVQSQQAGEVPCEGV